MKKLRHREIKRPAQGSTLGNVVVRDLALAPHLGAMCLFCALKGGSGPRSTEPLFRPAGPPHSRKAACEMAEGRAGLLAKAIPFAPKVPCI